MKQVYCVKVWDQNGETYMGPVRAETAEDAARAFAKNIKLFPEGLDVQSDRWCAEDETGERFGTEPEHNEWGPVSNAGPELAARRAESILAGTKLEHLETLEPELVDPRYRDETAALKPHLQACRAAAYRAGRDEYDVRFGFCPDERIIGVYLNDCGTWYRLAP